MIGDKKRIQEQMLINQAISSIRKQLNDLENSRKKYIEAAAIAKADGIASQYNLAKNAIRVVIEQKAIVNQMLLNLQMSAQIKDVSEMTKSFADGMKILSGAITETNGSMNFEKATDRINKAMVSTQIKQAEADAFMEATEAGFASIAYNTSSASGDDIDNMINEQSKVDFGEVDDEIAALEKKLKSGGKA